MKCSLMNRLLCYAHFDEKGELKGFVKHALEEMSKLCSKIIFVSNSPITPVDHEYLSTICSNIIINDNIGYDFYMWKSGLAAVDLHEYDQLMLMNSSIFGPLFPLDALFSEMSKYRYDCWGITECFQVRPHIQSYFLVIEKNLLHSKTLRLFWDSVLPYKDKHQVVLNYEVGFSQWIRESGYSIQAMIPFRDIAVHCHNTGRKVRKKDNTSIKQVVPLLELGNPFIKVEPIRSGAVMMSSFEAQLNSYGYPSTYLHAVVNVPAPVCPLCGSPGAGLYRRVRDFFDSNSISLSRYMKCKGKKCGVFWLNGASDARKFPVNDSFCTDHTFSSIGLSATIGKQGFLSRKLVTTKKGRVLMLPDAKLHEYFCRHKWDVVILNAETEQCSEQGIQTKRLESDQFDLVLLPHFLEHLKDPTAFLAEMLRVLKLGGSLILSTPNPSSLTALVFKNYWIGLDAPRHLYLFERTCLGNLLSSSGYRVERLGTSTVNMTQFARHSLDALHIKWTTALFDLPLNKRMMSLLPLVAWLLNKVSSKRGDESFAIATKI